MMLIRARKCRAERHMQGPACQGRRDLARRDRGSSALDRPAPICTLGLPAVRSHPKPDRKRRAPMTAATPSSPTSMTTSMTTAEATVAPLIAHGLDTVYALPGVHNDVLFDALFRAHAPFPTV